MPVLSLKIIASLLQMHGPGATIQSDHQGIDAILDDVRGQISEEGVVLPTPGVTDVAFRRGGFVRGGGGSKRRRIPQGRICRSRRRVSQRRVRQGLGRSFLVLSRSGVRMSTHDPGGPVFQDQPIAQLLIKVASRCNIDCSYCYWFRDAAVYSKPKLMAQEVLQQLLWRIEEHVINNSLPEFPLILHGGEPLLWGVENFYRISEACETISARTNCAIPIAVTTNGILIDEAWLDCFETRDIAVAISLDGPAHIHDINRRTFQGTGTHAAVERAARLLTSRDINVTALAVCNPAH